MKQLKIFIAVLLVLFIASCDKYDNQATGVGDALIFAKKSGSSTVYGISLNTYSFSDFESVKAYSSKETTKIYTLKASPGYNTNFYYETPDAELSTTKPAASTINFSAVFSNGVTQEFQDVLSDQVLAVPVVNKCEYNATTKQLEMTWTAVTNANSYAIVILDNSKLVFRSVELASTVVAQDIKAAGSGWATDFTPVSGKSYTVRLSAFLYETGTSSSYDLQASSVAEKSVVWGN